MGFPFLTPSASETWKFGSASDGRRRQRWTRGSGTSPFLAIAMRKRPHFGTSWRVRSSCASAHSQMAPTAYGLQIPYAGGKAGDKATRSTSQGGSIWRRWAAGAIAKPRLFSSIARRVATASTIGAQRSATLLCASSRDGAHLKSQKRDRLSCCVAAI